MSSTIEYYNLEQQLDINYVVLLIRKNSHFPIKYSGYNFYRRILVLYI